MPEFTHWPKISRLSREVIVTEKIDGTNAAIAIELLDPSITYAGLTCTAELDNVWYVLYSQSRTRFIHPGDDNFAFALWVKNNAHDLVRLGPGVHHGEWWGRGIQRNYGLKERRFSLFNVTRWTDPALRPACCHVVPVLYQGPFSTPEIDLALGQLALDGSAAAPGFMDPEGIIVYHTAANVAFKKTIKDDETPKGAK